MGRRYAAVDIGGTNTVVALFDEGLHLLEQTRFSTPRPVRPGQRTDPAPHLDALAAEVSRLAKKHADGGILTALGVDSPGRVDTRRGIVYNASNLGWAEVHLRDELGARLGVPVAVEHDVRAFLRGEMAVGAAAGKRDVVAITIGTGIAAAFLSGGVLLEGAAFRAGEIGHDRVEGGTEQCTCGKCGCLETVVSGPGIVRAAEKTLKAGRLSAWTHLQGRMTAADVASAAQEGDLEAARIFVRVAGALAGKLSTCIYALDPECIVVGGGVANAGELLFAPLRQAVRVRCPDRLPPLEIVQSQLGAQANLIGMAHLARKLEEEGDA